MTEKVTEKPNTATYDTELDYYFNVYDSDCGLKSVGLGGLAAALDSQGNRHRGKYTPDTVRPKSVSVSKPIHDPWANLARLEAFNRGRLAWNAFARLWYSEQEALRQHYTELRPRLPDQDWGRSPPDPKVIVEATSAFRRYYNVN
jgi:hypothetical protein